MRILEKKTKCVGCSACANACPRGCILMVKDKEGFIYPLIDKDKCVSCGMCKNSCPQQAEIISNGVVSTKVAINKDERICKDSSSGGVFYALASEIINAGGVVFGAGFDGNFAVRHMSVKKTEDIRKLMGSKYVQSYIGTCYSEVKQCLEREIPVLFSGTPCQIAGLHAYLKKSYSHLVTVDIICHGVPSPGLWEKYIEEQKNVRKSSIEGVNFRAKEKGWGNYSLKINFDNGEVLCQTSNENLYMLAFAQNLSLRPSCYDCDYKEKRFSDLTIADFWGIRTIHPEWYSEQGVSLLISHTTKGECLVERICEQVDLIETDFVKAISFNRSYKEAAVKNIRRKKFFNYLLNNTVSDSLNKFIASPLIWRLEIKIRSILSKI